MSKPDKIFLKKMLKRCGKTINRHNLIKADEHILLALSGGKDSLALLDIISRRRKHLPVNYKLTAAFINIIGITDNVDQSKLDIFCKERDAGFISQSVDVDFTQDADPCFACSWHRRKILFEMCRNMNIKTLALGHTLDDTSNTLLMNIFFQGNISSMTPSLNLFDGNLKIIRPLIETDEKDITHYCNLLSLPIQKGKCHYGKAQKRNQIDELIKEIEKTHPKVRNNIYSSLSNIRSDYLPDQF